MALNQYDDALEQLPPAPPPPTPAAPANPYDDTIQQLNAGHEQRLRTALVQADQTTPDRAADAARLAERTGVPVDVVERNFDAIQKRARLTDTPYSQMLRDTPAVATWAAEPQHAAVAKDDMEQLGALEWLVTAIPRAQAQGINQARYGELRLKSMFTPLSREEQDLLEAYKFHSSAGGKLGAGDSWFKGAITGGMRAAVGLIVPEALPLAIGAGVGAVVGGVAGSVVPGPGTVAGAATGAQFGARAGYTIGLGKSTFETSTAGAYDEYLDLKDEHGQPMDPAVAKAAAFLVGGLNAGIMLGPGAAILKNVTGVGKLTGLATRSAVSQALRQPTIRAALGEMMKTYGVNLTEATALMVATKALDIMGAQLVKEQTTRGPVAGQLEPGNVDLFKQPKVSNADGSVSTVDSLSVGLDGKEVLLPTVTPDGRHFAGTDDERTAQAIAEYQKTGRHLGTFDTPAAATAFAQQLHADYAAGKYEPVSATQQLLDTAKSTIQDFSLLTAVTPGLALIHDAQRATRAQQAPAFFTALGEGVAQSKTAQRLPEAAQAFLEQATKDGPVATVYAPVASWTSYWQSQGVDPAEMAERVTGKRDAYELAQRTGEDLAIPTSRYATTIAATEHNAYFASELRLGPDEMNAREAAAFEAQLRAAIDGPKPEAPAESPVRTALLAQLEAAGVPADTADTYAALYESAFTTMAERAGVDPQQLYESYGLTVQRPDLEAAAPQPGDTDLSQLGNSELLPAGTQSRLRALGHTEEEIGQLTPDTANALLADAEKRQGGEQPSGPDLTATQLERNAAARAAQEQGDVPVHYAAGGMDPGAERGLERGAQDAARLAELRRTEASARVALGRTLFQSDDGPPTDGTSARRGAIRFGADRQFNIQLLEQADLSTFLHESGHFFLEVFTDLANEIAKIDPDKRTEQQQHLLADHAETTAWLADEDHSGAGFSVKQHEQFARGFEAYLMEGHAPSLGLHTTFARFRAWLVGVYRSLKGLSVQLTPEVRAVMDRLLATDRAIADVEAQRGVPQMFTTAESASMSEGEFGLYARTIADASKTAREQLDRQLLSEVQRERTATWKAQRAEVQATVEAEIHQAPAYRALAAILKGTRPDGSPLVEGVETPPMKLDRALIVERYGADRVRELPRGLTSADGLDPDTVARLFGFTSGDALLNAVGKAEPMKNAIEEETSHRMIAQHGSMLLDGSLHEKAQAAVANEDRDAVIRQEMRALGRLRRLVDPFLKQERAAGRRTAEHELAERDYERRWFEAEAKLRIAIAEGHQQVEIDALEQEVKDLHAQARGGPAIIKAAIPPAAVLRDTAEARVAAMPIRDVKPQVFWSASRRAAQQAIDLAARQDFDGAITAKQQELINLNLYRQAEKALVDVQTRVRFAKDLAGASARKSIGLAGATYLDQVDGILERFEFAKVPQTVLDRRASLRDWAEALEAQGMPVDLPEGLLNEARRRNYQELTVEELRGVTDGLKQIQHLARLKNRLLAAVDQRDFSLVRDGVVRSIRDHTETKALPLEFRPKDAKVRAIANWFASHTKIAILARALDGHEDGGAMWEAFIRPINAAADAEIVRKQEAGKAYTAIIDEHYPGRELATLHELLEIPAIKASLSKEGRLAVALNWGNQTSRDRILADPTRRWSAEQVHAILDTLDARDWHFVQATWDYLNTFWPEISAKQERLTGVPPDKVAALPLVTKFGDLAGGYYPLAYDGRLAPRADQLAAAGEAKLAVAAAYVASTTKRGHTKTRLENVKLPVRLELGVAFRHIEQVIHDLTHHEMLIDTTRLLRDPAITTAMLETKGDLVHQQFASMLQDIALGGANGTGKPSVVDSAAAFLRTRTQIAGMGWNLWTALQQPLGVFNGMSRVGPVWVARGMKRWLRDAASMENTATWVAEVSPMMRERVTTATQDLHDVKQALSQPGGWFDTLVRTVSADKLTQQTILDGYLWHIGVAQRVADIPTWLGGYEKAMAAGNTEARAIALADQGVLDSQGGGQIKDLAKVQRGGNVAKLFMTFYSYGNTVFNSVSDVAGATNFKSPASVATFLGHMSLLLVMPGIATEALRCASGKAKCTEWPTFVQSVGGQVLGDTMNMMVGLREMGAAAKLATGLDPGSRGYEGPAGTRLFSLVSRLAQQVHQGSLDEGLAQAANATAGVLFRYPAAQVQRTIDGWAALEDGRTTNPLALLFGAPPKKAAR